MGVPEMTTSQGIMSRGEPSVSHRRDFGSRCWYKFRNASNSKLFPHVCEEVLIGYSRVTTGYNLWDIFKRKVVVFFHVQFDELGEAQKTSLCPGEDDEGRDDLIDSMPDNNDEVTNEKLMNGQ